MGVSFPLVLFHFTFFHIIKYPRILFSYLGVFPPLQWEATWQFFICSVYNMEEAGLRRGARDG